MMMRKSEAMQFTKQPYIEDVGPRKIKSIQFSTFSGSEVMKSAEVEVYRGVYYDASKNPIPNGLLDPRMGPPNKTKSCATCNGDFKQCPGHYGYLNLALPVFNVGYLPIIVDILKCICKGCSRILLGEKERLDFLRKMRNTKMEHLKKNELLKRVVKRCTAMTSGRKAVICSRCGCVNGMVKKGPLKIIHEYGSQFLDECHNAVSNKIKGSITVPPELDSKTVHALFKKMIDEDCELLYLSDKPEKLLVTSIPVPPIAIRPSVFVDGGMQSNENDITERLKRIIQANSSLRQEISDTTLPARSLASWVDLQMEVAQYINSDVRGLPPQMQASRPLSGFVQRLKGKQGRFRGNLSGKRVEYTGRTVISPDPNLKITEVAIPILMARILTFPERVSRHNIEKLRQCVRNGPNKYPGAKYIRHPDGTEISLMYSSRKRHADELKYGYIVDRHLEDGDAVLFNRQPSLHRMSIMCHRARIMPWRTLRFNESVCNPYNADFDGDEMNMHVPQTVEARTEALLLMGVQNNLCTPKSGEILVASTQDFLTSSFLITRKDTFYDRASFSLMCSYMGDAMDHIDLPTPALIKPVELWTGKQLFGVLLRPYSKMRVYLNLTLKEKSYPREKGLEKGLETMCPSDGFVYFRNSELISGQLGKATLGNGNKDGLYSVLLRDYNTHGAAICMNRLAKLSARWIGNHGFSIGIDDVQPGKELVEKKTMEIEKGYGICEAYIASFKKGELEDAPGCDAAQTLEANITKELNAIRVKTGQAKGFVASSFYDGLSATEFFFHTMGGREGLVDTAVKTADTGYMSRRLMKALEDLSILYDRTVRNASSCIVQFEYGDDGMDPAQMEEKEGHPLNFNRLFMKVKATCPPGEEKSLSSSEIQQMMHKRLSEHDTTPDGGCSAAFCNSLKEFIENNCVASLEKTRKDLKLDGEHNAGEDLDALESITLNISGVTRKQLQKNYACRYWCLLLSANLFLYSCNKVFLETCISRYHEKKLEDGTSIGAIGAQSIGEPGTQMTLKTFHFAGVASMSILVSIGVGVCSNLDDVTLGVPRIKEIINAAKRISTPIIEAKLSCDDNQKFARIVKGRIEKTLLGQVAKSIKIVMAARVASIVIVLDLEAILTSCLSIDAYIVKESILQTKKIKLKEQHIKVLDPGKLEVIPHADRSKLHFELHRLKNKLPGVVVKGINTVERAVINKDEKEKEMGKEKYNLLVEGTGLLAVMGTDGVVGCNTKTNHIMEVNQVLGIEAARERIIGEIQYIMKQHGMTIDVRHMMLLADLMTFKGEVLGITRFGIQKMKDSVLTLASFEKTADHLFNASVSGRDDKIEGVGECIIMGIPMDMGTGMLKVMQSNTSHPIELNYGKESIIPRD
nr:DNA-directed RNA polymerase III subunit 1-like isoform X2 [Ipomoea trifida]